MSNLYARKIERFLQLCVVIHIKRQVDLNIVKQKNVTSSLKKLILKHILIFLIVFVCICLLPYNFTLACPDFFLKVWRFKTLADIFYSNLVIHIFLFWYGLKIMYNNINVVAEVLPRSRGTPSGSKLNTYTLNFSFTKRSF